MRSQENRVKYNQENYHRVFEDIPDAPKELEASESEPSLSECIQFWLERTPGLEEEGFNFPAKFKEVVDGLLRSDLSKIEVGASGCENAFCYPPAISKKASSCNLSSMLMSYMRRKCVISVTLS